MLLIRASRAFPPLSNNANRTARTQTISARIPSIHAFRLEDYRNITQTISARIPSIRAFRLEDYRNIRLGHIRGSNCIRHSLGAVPGVGAIRGARQGLPPHPEGARPRPSAAPLEPPIRYRSIPFAYAAGGTVRSRPGPPLRPFEPRFALDSVRLRGGRQGATRPPAPPARDFVPWNPDSMH